MSPLGPRIERVRQAYRACRICPRDCGADRTIGATGAFCGLDERAWVYKDLLSYGEEALIGPTWLLDLGGCSLRCLFCTEWQHITHPTSAPAGLLTPGWFTDRMATRREQGARTVSFVGGDPTVSLLGILRALAETSEKQRLPVVWNCNGWASELVHDTLDGVVACWTVDLKFGQQACADRLAGAGPDYLTPVRATLDRIHRDLPERAVEGALPGLIIRHLVMPGHLSCCTLPLIEQAARRWPRAVFNLMTMYLPFGPALSELPKASELRGTNHDDDRARAISTARERLDRLLIDGKAAS